MNESAKGGKSPAIVVEASGREVRVSNPDRVYFPEIGFTKRDLVDYYLAVGDGIVRSLFERPCMLHRYPEGIEGEKVHQKRVPRGAPPWLETVRVRFPRYNRTADELCVTEIASVIWAVQMSTVEFHPWNSRRADVEKPDEWRIDLDPGPECDWARVQRVAAVAREVLDELADPVEFLIGGHDLPPAVETALQEHGSGDALDLYLEPEKTFGTYDEQLVFLLPRSALPEQVESGMLIEARTLPSEAVVGVADDHVLTISEIYPDHVVLDGNHPLAGMALRLQLKVGQVRPATADEVRQGSVGPGFFRLQVAPGPDTKTH